MDRKSAIDELENEFLSEDGFFCRLHFRDFRPDLAPHALDILRATQITSDHAGNYRLAYLLFGAQFELDSYFASKRDDAAYEAVWQACFELISLRFEELRMLGETVSGQAAQE